MKFLKKYLINGLYGSGLVVGFNSFLFSYIDLITYSEAKKAAYLAMGLLGVAYVLDRLVNIIK